jgi:ribosomal RNA-processing protein 36
MSSLKRKSLDDSLQRRVRARRESTEELESAGSVASANGADIEETSDASQSEAEEVRVCLLDHQSESSLIIFQSESSESESPDGAASISFGALAKAQENLTRPLKSTKLGTKTSKTEDDTWEDNEAVERKAGRKDHRDFGRSSKHAPTEISSKKAVSRKREVVPVAKREYRDPRFEPLVGEVDDSKIRKAYSFLDEYREDEMKELKSVIKTTKDEDAREKLKRALASMESRKKAQMRKDKEKEILDHHRKEEKELVKQGKKPFYLKKSEQKKRVLLDQYGNLKGKQLDRVIERRRKKVEGKEKKKMPFSRRGASS